MGAYGAYQAAGIGGCSRRHARTFGRIRMTKISPTTSPIGWQARSPISSRTSHSTRLVPTASNSSSRWRMVSTSAQIPKP